MNHRRLIEVLRVLSWGGRLTTWKLVWAELRRRWYAEELSVGFELDLRQPFESSGAEVPLVIRELTPTDVPLLLGIGNGDLDVAELRSILIRRLLVEARLPTCYVGVDAEDRPCCMCWLARAEDNDRYRDYYGEGYQPLRSGEVLCEEIYTHPDHRGQRLMKQLTHGVLAMAACQDGAWRALAFIRANNHRSLAGASVTGWEPFVYRRVSWRLFRRQVSYQWASSAAAGRGGHRQAQPQPALV